MITFGRDNNRIRTPIPALILQRITSGIYYDLVAGPSNLRNEAAARFERYAASLVAAMLPRFDVSQSHAYRDGHRQFDTPDVLVRDAGYLIATIECKATKLTLQAQFAEDPYSEATSRYDEIANGVFQIWRYYAHLRRDITRGGPIHPEAIGLVLTMDPWAMMGGSLQRQLLMAASRLADQEGGIGSKDRRPVIFASIADVESVLTRADETAFAELLRVASHQASEGWMLPNVQRDAGLCAAEAKPYPFALDEVLPWWQSVSRLQTDTASA